MSGAVPVDAVTSALYAEYFSAGGANVTGMSSHWRTYAPKSSVRVDAQGRPVEAVGVGFGDMNTRRFGNAAFTSLATLLHALRHPARRQLPSAIAATRRTTGRASLVFNQDALRQALTFALLADRLAHEPIRRILMIGDGYGVLGATLAAWRPDAQVVFVDLGRSLLFQALTCGRNFPSAAHALVGRDGIEQVSQSRFVYWPADRLEGWRPGPIDLAINIASMQEMSADTIAAYFELLRRAPATWFYCCNRERKIMPDGEVAEFAKYPWSAADQHLIDGLCPWHQWYVAPAKGRVLPVSLLAHYDGPHLHRLTLLATEETQKNTVREGHRRNTEETRKKTATEEHRGTQRS